MLFISAAHILFISIFSSRLINYILDYEFQNIIANYIVGVIAIFDVFRHFRHFLSSFNLMSQVKRFLDDLLTFVAFKMTPSL